MSSHTLTFVEGFCRGLAAGLLVLAICASSARAEEVPERLRWERAAVADDVAITVHVVGVDELRRLTGSNPFAMPTARQSHRKGLAKLYRNTASGAWTCHVYVLEDATEQTLEHELRHCHGWVHQ